MLKSKLPILLSIFLLISISGYTQKNKKPRRAKRVVKSEKVLLETQENDMAVVQLGDSLQSFIANNNIEEFVSFWDFNAFAEFIQENVVTENSTSEFESGFFNGVQKGLNSLPTRIAEQVENESYYDFVSYRYDEEEKTYYILFRLFSLEGGFNYHDFRIGKLNDQFVFNDIYIYLSGEPLSETMRRFYIQSLPDKKKLNLFGKKKAQEMQKLLEGVAQNRTGNFEQAYENLNSISGDLAKDKFVLLIKSQVAGNLDEELYIKAIEELREAHPNDKTLYLNYIDYYTLQEDFVKTLELLDQLKLDTQDDFLRFMEGNLRLLSEDIEGAKEDYEYIMENYPDFIGGYSAYIGALVSLEDYNGAVNTLDELVDQGYEKTDLIEFVEEVDELGYNEFKTLVTSDAYINWKTQ